MWGGASELERRTVGALLPLCGRVPVLVCARRIQSSPLDALGQKGSACAPFLAETLASVRAASLFFFKEG